MEAKLRNWFSRKSSSQDQRRPSVLRGQSYENTAAGEAPVKGGYPVRGNGPHGRNTAKSHSYGQQDDTAEAPNVPRQRSDSFSSRPKTAPHNGFGSTKPASSSGRTRSGFSMIAPPNFSKKRSVSNIAVRNTPSPRDLASPRSFSERPPTALSSAYTALSQQSSHVDIFDAASTFNPSRSSSRNYVQGGRDYGEDVADRNIAVGNSRPDYGEAVANRNIREYGGGVEPETKTWYRSSQSSQASSHAVSTYSSRRAHGLGIGSVSGGSSTWNANGSGSWGAVSGRPGDDIPKQDLAHYRDSTSTTTTTSNSISASFPSHSTPHLTTSPIIGVAAIPPSNFYLPPSQPSLRSPSAFLEDSGVSFSSSSQAQYTPPASTKAYIPPRVDSAALNNHSSSTSYEQTSSPLHNHYTTTPASRHRVIEHEKGVLNHKTASALPPLSSRYRHSAVQTLPTPPMSPTSASDSPTSPRNKPNLDKTLPSPPGRSRGNSATYTPFPPQYHTKRSSQTSNAAPDGTSRDPASESTVLSRTSSGAQNRSGFVVEGAAERPSLDGIVDLTNTTDTEVITKHLPAVVHEHITPEVHHINEERITREIHHHDVFHRIQPIREIEVLPTKHYMPHPSIPGQLIEIPESAIPGRQNNWKIVTEDLGTDAADSPTIPPDQHAAHTHKEPVKTSERHYTDDNGVERSETVWQHAPRLETSGAESGKTVPLKMNCLPPNSENEARNDPNRSSTSNEGEPLFKDHGYGVGGMLPGLDEPTPTKYPGMGHGAGGAGATAAQSRTTPPKSQPKVRSMLDIGEDEEVAGDSNAPKQAIPRSKDEWDLRQLQSPKGKGHGKETDGGDLDEVTSGVKNISMRERKA